MESDANHNSRASVDEGCQARESSRDSAERYRTLAGRLIAAQESERRRIALELHDDLSQRLVAIGIEISAIKKWLPETETGMQERLSGIRCLALETANDVRHLSHELHPSGLTHFGLAVALASCCDEFVHNTGIKIELTSRPNRQRLPAEIELGLYRVVQEALRNIASHSQARLARVSLNTAGDIVELVIADDGIGFDPQQARGGGGLGLLGMEERARLLGGRLEIHSQPQRGAKLTLAVPMSLPAPEPMTNGVSSKHNPGPRASSERSPQPCAVKEQSAAAPATA